MTLRTNPPGPGPSSSNIAASGGAGSSEPDMALVGELLEGMSRNPPAIAARKLLVEHYMTIGWLDAATENTKDLKKLAPRDPDVTRFLAILSKKPEPTPPLLNSRLQLLPHQL